MSDPVIGLIVAVGLGVHLVYMSDIDGMTDDAEPE